MILFPKIVANNKWLVVAPSKIYGGLNCWSELLAAIIHNLSMRLRMWTRMNQRIINQYLTSKLVWTNSNPSSTRMEHLSLLNKYQPINQYLSTHHQAVSINHLYTSHYQPLLNICQSHCIYHHLCTSLGCHHHQTFWDYHVVTPLLVAPNRPPFKGVTPAQLIAPSQQLGYHRPCHRRSTSAEQKPQHHHFSRRSCDLRAAQSQRSVLSWWLSTNELIFMMV